MSVFGTKLMINLFGESHGSGVGITINNFPPGVKIDLDRISENLKLRRPKSKISTPRVENDDLEILSGYFEGFSTGAPLTFFIKNQNTRSRDYNPNILRPSHADFTAYAKFEGFQDYRGSGHFSGRVTAPLMILGALCQGILEEKGIYIGSHIASIKDVLDDKFSDETLQAETVKSLSLSDFPVLNKDIEHVMREEILNAKDNQDSVGGTIESAIIGLSPGYGIPFFHSIESTISHLLFSVPAVKGVSFGKGFDITKLFGSQANDSFILKDGKVQTKSNNSGGIQGGISNGMPILVNTAVKPTASIGKTQQTVDYNTMKEVELNLVGRHDPSIVPRVIHVINAVLNYAVLEIILQSEGYKWIK